MGLDVEERFRNIAKKMYLPIGQIRRYLVTHQDASKHLHPSRLRLAKNMCPIQPRNH